MSDDKGTPRTFYRIRNWNEDFENNRTRELKYLEWVAFPNPMIRGGGDAYAELMDHPDGAAHFGFWCACVFLAARSHPRGTLLREGGVPHSQASIALTCRIPAPMCEIAARRLIHLGFLEEVPFTKQGLSQPAPSRDVTARMPHGGAGKPQEPATTRARANGREGKGNTTPPTPPLPGGAPHRTTRQERHDAAVYESMKLLQGEKS